MKFILWAIFFSLLNLNLYAQSTLTMALAPYPVTGGMSIGHFNSKVEEYALSASKARAQWIVFPELFTFDLLSENPEDKLFSELEKVSSFYSQYEALGKMLAQKYQIWMTFGSTLKKENFNKMKNVSLTFSPDGKVFDQEKIFPTPWEKKNNIIGGSILNIIASPWGNVIILICYDSEFAEISALLASHTPVLLIVPSMTDDLFGFHRVASSAAARSVEHLAFSAVVGAIGKTKTWHSYEGNTQLISPHQKDYPNTFEKSKMGDSKLTIHTLNFEPMKKLRLDPSSIYPVRDFKNFNRELKIEVKK